MDINPLWNVWLNASIIKAFKDAFTSWPLFFVGVTEGNEEDVAVPDINGRVSIYIDVDKQRLTYNQYQFKATVTVMLTSSITNDSYAHIRNEGVLEANIPSCIVIREMGTDDDVEFATIQWDSEVKPLRSPATGPNARVAQSVYELHYEGTI